MKMVDLFALSLGYCKTGLKRLVIPMLMVCIGVVGLCFAGAAHIAVWEDKREPVMLNLTSGDKADVGEMAYAEILAMEGVTKASLQIAFSGEITLGEHTRQLSITAIDSGMIAQPLALGELYPASSNMPYIVLDRADYLAFIGASATTKEIPLDAFRVNLTLSVGGEKTFTAQICGILEDEAADSAGGGMGDTGGTAYMGLDTARRILGESGQELRLNSLAVWVESYYAAADVIEQAAPLGLTEDGGMLALLDGWAAKEGEANFLMIAAALLLLCAFLLLRAKLTLLFAHKAPELTLLHELGLPQRRVGRVVRGAGLLAGLCAAVVTVLVCVALPFIVAEGLPESVFALHMPVEVLAEGFAVCVVAGVGCMVRLGID